MRLRELKCENCGAVLKVEDNVTKVKCEFCKTEFAVEDAYHAGYKFEKGRMKAQTENLEENLEQAQEMLEAFHKSSPIPKIVIGFIITVFITVFIIIFVTIFKELFTVSEFDINRFNNTYEMYNGTEYGSSVGRLIDEVSTNNKKNKKQQITIKYKDVTTKEPEKMKEIKSELDDWTKYEVTFEYDDDGFIYQATIE